jgi:hypothetical protein
MLPIVTPRAALRFQKHSTPRLPVPGHILWQACNCESAAADVGVLKRSGFVQPGYDREREVRRGGRGPRIEE